MISYCCLLEGSAFDEFNCFLGSVLLQELRRKSAAACDTVARIGEVLEPPALVKSLYLSSSTFEDDATVVCIISGEGVRP